VNIKLIARGIGGLYNIIQIYSHIGTTRGRSQNCFIHFNWI